MPSGQPAKLPRYSATYEDDTYQYRHVILDKSMVSLIPKNRLMDECEWRALGIKQGPHWEHYLIHKPEPFVLMFRRLLNYCNEPDPSIQQQQNTHFPTTRIPSSANLNSSFNHPLGDSTNTKNNLNIHPGYRVAINPYKIPNNNFNESGFESYCDD